MRLASLFVLALLSIAPGCASNPPIHHGDGGTGGMDGSTTDHRDGSTPPSTGPCGGANDPCCVPGRICELGLHCGRGDVCCIQAGSSALCDTAADCCAGLACQGSVCRAPGGTACTGSSDCSMGLVCSEGVCVEGSEAPGPSGCGMPGAVCCDGFTCSSGMACVEGTCASCGDEGQPCCDGSTPCVGATLGCEISHDDAGTITGTECVDVSDPSSACGEIDRPCCADATGTPADCSGDLVCRGGTCLMPDDTGFMGAPCTTRGSCDPMLVCDHTTDPDGLCTTTPEDCGRDGMSCCDLGGSEPSCEGSLHCQFNSCSECRGPSLSCLLGGLLPGQECCAGSVCRPAPLIPRCCMGQGGACTNGLDCCGLMGCRDGMCSCSNMGSFCLDSSECCDGLTCQTFTCQPAPMGGMCKEVGTGCTGSSECCAGLTCSETRTEPTAPAVRQCCGASETSCESNEDCCGQMLCEGGSCQCVARAGLCDRDVECCEGDICIVGSCQDGHDCKRERQECDPTDANSCCGQLRCLHHYMEDADYCCVGQGERCRESTDCCGNMMCDPDSERCREVDQGSTCNTQFDCAAGYTCAADSDAGTERHCVCASESCAS